MAALFSTLTSGRVVAIPTDVERLGADAVHEFLAHEEAKDATPADTTHPLTAEAGATGATPRSRRNRPS